ncbi:hypothetical protein ADIS_1702 [Lunatimonas lonarensis]|uniref:Uncharacterized protein n=1 Tax=Lunatimonas lonarensis TaxID=1232681 RepID=R7ZUS8_9BACT|nr:hypothetical protein ADIS_1702 [Lunatimonas lonarensis]
MIGQAVSLFLIAPENVKSLGSTSLPFGVLAERKAFFG